MLNVLQRQDEICPEPENKEDSTMPTFDAGGAGHGFDEVPTIDPIRLLIGTTYHPSNPAHHTERRRRDSAGHHQVQPPLHSLAKPFSLRQSRIYPSLAI